MTTTEDGKKQERLDLGSAGVCPKPQSRHEKHNNQTSDSSYFVHFLILNKSNVQTNVQVKARLSLVTFSFLCAPSMGAL